MARKKKLESDFAFRLMTLIYKLRDLLQNPRKSLEKAQLRRGMSVVDYGCGPGSFTIPAAELVGQEGKVFAVDIYPLAISAVKQKTSRKGLQNVETILVKGYDTGIEASSIDRVLLIDTIHLIEDTDALFREIHRMLKPDGLLFMEKGHMAMPEQKTILDRTGLFKITEAQGLMILAAPQR
ncbi:MAG: class I SAM-dependent methyltransferase [Dehalococcoidia bacterium]|jgi:ubiquinone/menaquinone biosynthesis C-methylase UbiE